jgi:hypothetical protein
MVLDLIVTHAGDIILGTAVAFVEVIADWISELFVELLLRIMS